MPQHVLRLLPPLNFISPYPIVGMYQQTASIIHNLNLLNLLINDLLLYQWFFHVYIEYPYIPTLIRDVQLLILIVPEYRSVNCFVGVFYAKEFTAVSGIEALELLVETNSEHEVCLNY